MSLSARFAKPNSLLIGSSVLLLALALYQVVASPSQKVDAQSAVHVERVLTIKGTISGETAIYDEDGHGFANPQGTEGVFISTIERAMRRERIKRGVDPYGPYVLKLSDGSRLSLYDPSTDREISIESYGHDNRAAFIKLLPGQ